MDMTAVIGFEEFKKQADIIHHNRFKYDPSSYTNTRGSIKFFDPVTNDNYEQRIVNHLKGSLPRELQKKEFTDKSQSEFIVNATSVHNGFYSYGHVKYVNNQTKVLITCSKHGDIETTPYKLLIQEYGCLRCSQELIGERSLLDGKEWRPRLIELHPNLDFSKSIYNGYDYPIEFKCPMHGKQSRLAGKLFQGYGCELCSKNGNE